MTNNPVILFRLPSDSSNEYKLEADIASKYFSVCHKRTDIKALDLVIGRYSVLPFYKELEADIGALGGKLINSYSQHRFVANLGAYVPVLEELTPETWVSTDQLPDDIGPVILKGETNSLKHKWNTHMFAKNKQEAIQTCIRLREAMGINNTQDIYIRRFVELETFMIGMNGQPITNEYRIFVCDGKVMAGGYYWSSHVDDLPVKPSFADVPKEFIQEVIDRIDNRIRFYVIDVARTKEGKWIVVELNDGCMSGTSEVDLDELYGNLRKHLLTR